MNIFSHANTSITERTLKKVSNNINIKNKIGKKEREKSQHLFFESRLIFISSKLCTLKKKDLSFIHALLLSSPIAEKKVADTSSSTLSSKIWTKFLRYLSKHVENFFFANQIFLIAAKSILSGLKAFLCSEGNRALQNYQNCYFKFNMQLEPTIHGFCKSIWHINNGLKAPNCNMLKQNFEILLETSFLEKLSSQIFYYSTCLESADITNHGFVKKKHIKIASLIYSVLIKCIFFDKSTLAGSVYAEASKCASLIVSSRCYNI